MQKDYFTLLDILPALLWLIIIVVAGFAIRNANTDKPHYKYYMPNLFVKLFFSLAFASFYILIYGGGDTTAYYECSSSLNNLFFKSPELYFEQLFSAPDRFKYTTYFDQTTGYPPGWIYNEPQGFFVSKIISLFTFFTLKSYLATTFILAYISSIVSWKLFEMVLNFELNNENYLAIGILFLPSVNFWCTGISKDMVVLTASLLLIVNLFKIISIEHTFNFKNIVFAFLAALIVYHIRSFILIAILLPILFSLGIRLVKSLGGGAWAVIFFRIGIASIGIFAILQSLTISNEAEFLESNSYLEEASVIQRDFQTNKIYGSKQYDLGEVSFTPVGLARVAPLAIITGIYRPFPWEALSVTLLMNGIESILFFYFTFLFIKKSFRAKIRIIRKHEFLVFCLFFVIIVAYMTGLTSILYGVLVRLRAPLLPFLFIIFTIDWSKFDLDKKLTKA